MKQPEIGRKIAELRKQHGFTQEDLAYKANMNVRSIQRLESGDVIPRVSTLYILSKILDYDFNADSKHETDFWLLFMHLSCVFPIVIPALVVWIWRKDENLDIQEQGMDVINFQISMCVYLFAGAMLVFVAIGILILPLLGIFIFFVSIINTIKVAMDQSYKYPLTINFIKNEQAM